MCRFSRDIQSLRAALASAADSSLISARSDTTVTRCAGNVCVHAGAELCLGVGEPAVAVQQEFLIAGQPVLVTGEDAQQRHLRGRRAQPRRVGGAVRLDVRHAPAGERGQHTAVADDRLGLILGAPVLGEEPVIRLDDLRWHQPMEQLLNACALGAGRYHESAPQPAPQAGNRRQRPGVGGRL